MKNIIDRKYLGIKGEYIILSIIFIIAFMVRLYKIDNPVADWHSFRQADTASVTREFLESGIRLFTPTYHDISTTQSGLFNPQGYRFVELPVFNVFNVYLYKIIPGITIEVAGRLVSIISAVVSAFVLYKIGMKISDKKVGMLAALFYSVLPFNIFFTRVILPEPLAVTFALASVYTFILYTEKKDTKKLFISSALLSVSVLIKPYLIFYGVPIIYLACKNWKIKRLLKEKRNYIAVLVILIPFLAWRIWMQRFPEGIPFWKWTFNGDDIRFRPSFWRWIFGERLSKMILGYWGLIPFAFGILSEKKNSRFVSFFLLGMFLYVSVIATANVRHDYYQTIAIPAVCLALAKGTVYMWNDKTLDRLLLRGFLGLSLIIMMMTSLYQIREFYNINHPEILRAGEAVDRLVPKDSLVIAAYNGDTAFLYQTKRKGWPVVDRPIRELIENGAEFYVSVNLGHYQTMEFMEEFKVLEITEEYVIVDLREEI